MCNIVVIGSGNVATHLSRALANNGMNIVQVYSRNIDHAAVLARKLGASYTDSLTNIASDADVYLFAVKDDVIASLASDVAGAMTGTPVFIHTSGSTPASVFQGVVARYGVLYPLQTFSVARDVDFRNVPCFVEGSDKETEDLVRSLAATVAERVVVMNSEQRRLMHLAAVWACNFVNHCYDVADELMRQCDLPFDLLLPLIDETASKVHELSPRQAQTGPGVRFDRRIIDKHIELMSSQPLRAEIYRRMSESIHENVEHPRNEK